MPIITHVIFVSSRASLRVWGCSTLVFSILGSLTMLSKILKDAHFGPSSNLNTSFTSIAQWKGFCISHMFFFISHVLASLGKCHTQLSFRCRDPKLYWVGFERWQFGVPVESQHLNLTHGILPNRTVRGLANFAHVIFSSTSCVLERFGLCHTIFSLRRSWTPINRFLKVAKVCPLPVKIKTSFERMESYLISALRRMATLVIFSIIARVLTRLGGGGRGWGGAIFEFTYLKC